MSFSKTPLYALTLLVLAPYVHAEGANGDLTELSRLAAGQLADKPFSTDHAMHGSMSKLDAEDKKEMMRACASMMREHHQSGS
jgi:hypothetical protein